MTNREAGFSNPANTWLFKFLWQKGLREYTPLLMCRKNKIFIPVCLSGKPDFSVRESLQGLGRERQAGQVTAG